MDRIFFREREEERQRCEMQQLNIGVTGLSQGTGATFVATALAFYFRDQGKQVSFVQCLQEAEGKSLLHDSVAMDQRFARRTFRDAYQMVREDCAGPLLRNVEEGINWILPQHRKEQKEKLDDSQKHRLVLAVRDEVCIFDFEADYTWDRLLLDMDLIVVVTDPLPSKLISGTARFAALKKMEIEGSKLLWAVNKDNDGVSRRQVGAFLKKKPDIWIPLFPMEKIYRCEYGCNFIWKDEEIKRKMTAIFTKVSPFQTSL